MTDDAPEQGSGPPTWAPHEAGTGAPPAGPSPAGETPPPSVESTRSPAPASPPPTPETPAAQPLATAQPSATPPAPSPEGEPAAPAAPRKKRRASRRLVLEYALTAVVALVVAFVVQAYVVKPYRVPTPSMATTIQPGDRVLIDRFLFDDREIGHGDIVVFTGPAAVGNQVLLKRVIGLPGDVLELKDGVLYVNGVADDAGGVTNAAGETPSTQPAYGQLEEHPEWSLYEPYTVPADHFYLLGDNRSDSFDSRYWGPVPRSSIIGKAFAVYWPLREVRMLE